MTDRGVVINDREELDYLPVGTIIRELSDGTRLKKVSVALGTHEVLGWADIPDEDGHVWASSSVDLPVAVE